ncbi:Lysosomal thioesterase PPT2-A [Phytophthora citrophthora]|uniref:Lysosomal thioesterase PPT2-A n=1 Tax=Phytophthora citrophthora TaxID=4793 RepID=A0AAD9GMT8_9STRA|nr:Lysosomal thioesterase PPT2-A [Phytophthora citrophthora]
MFGCNILLPLVSCAVALVNVASAASNLPVIFFHGVTRTYEDGENFVANLTAEGRTVASLSFCDGICSIQSLLTQVPNAVKAVREVVANNSAYDNGYIFIGHSLGGPISRAVMEEMDDHKVKRYISLGGLQNGQFIGPERVEKSIADGGAFFRAIIPETAFNYSVYGPEDYYGKMQKEFVLYTIENPDAQYTYAQFNVNRWPQFGSFSTGNFFLPVYNNVNRCLPGDDQCIFDQHRRKANFLRVEEAHFFASPADDIIMPWESSIFGRYSEVDTIEEIETQYKNLTVVDMKDTLEYTSDTFGLQTLDKRGGLFLHTVENVSHKCWVQDEGDCKFAPVYDQYLYPTLV